MSVRAIGIREVEGYLKDPRTRLVDLRDEEEYALSHLEGAINIPYEENFRPEQRFERNYRYILYCDRGGASLKAARQLSALGYEVFTVIGGLRAYEELYGE